MPPKLLAVIALLFLSNTVWGGTFAEMKAAKRQFEREGRTEQARVKYVGKLAELLEHEIAEHITSRGHNREIDKLDAELKKHPAPRTADTRQLTFEWANGNRPATVTFIARLGLGEWLPRVEQPTGIGGSLAIGTRRPASPLNRGDRGTLPHTPSFRSTARPSFLWMGRVCFMKAV